MRVPSFPVLEKYDLNLSYPMQAHRSVVALGAECKGSNGMVKPSYSVAKRLRWYWQMEAGNAVLVPVTAWVLIWSVGGAATAAFWVAVLACAALLVIGALYWRAVLRRIEGAAGVFEYWLPRLAAAENFMLALVSLSAIVVVLELTLSSRGLNAAIVAAAILTALAALEYVNYYKVQLQHFDNLADFKRLMAGRGFRKAHMARDIAAQRSLGGKKSRVD